MTRIPHPHPARDYAAIISRHELSRPFPRHTQMRRAIDILYGAIGSTGVSWIGFYEKVPGADEMVLVCREPKPACSPIGLHGMCGRGMIERKPIIIDDVRTLGEGYIACDPKDQSELVIPLIADDGSCDAVLDVDSYDLACFSEYDVHGMSELLVRIGLSAANLLELPCLRL